MVPNNSFISWRKYGSDCFYGSSPLCLKSHRTPESKRTSSKYLYHILTTICRSRDIVFAVFVFRHLDRAQRLILGLGPVRAIHEGFRAVGRMVFGLIMKVPSVKAKVDEEVAEILEKVETDMIDRSLESYPELPTEGWSKERVSSVLDDLQNMKHSDYERGRVSGAVYHGGKDLLAVQADAYARYATANQLHPDVFPGVRKMESEIVSMVLKLFNAPESGCGTSTSGGTESLLLTCLAARQKAYEERGVTEPEIVAPVTIHAAFNKAAYYFNMKLVHAPIDSTTGRVNLASVRRLVNRNTVLIAGSAPNFPHGVIDDIEGLGEIALKRGIPLHVDACLGSFIVPFLEEIGYADELPLFDFRVPGVTSISCDTHKYGFAPKGSSIIMYRDREMRARQYFVSSDWSGGIYASPTLAGSRPGALMAGCWATLVSMGRAGYLQSAREIVDTAMEFRRAIESSDFPSLRVIGKPVGPVVAFTSDEINIYDLGDAMSKRGWHLASIQNPAALHIACTRLTVGHIDELLSDLKECVSELQQAGSTSESAKGTAALYGVAGSVKTVGVVERIAEGFVDNLYKI